MLKTLLTTVYDVFDAFSAAYGANPRAFVIFSWKNRYDFRLLLLSE
jgi:hypothetical protein